MGVAGWHEVGNHQIFPTKMSRRPEVEFPSWFMPCVWRDDYYAEMHQANPDFIPPDKTIYRDMHTDACFAEFGHGDIARLAEMGDRKHWFLAPIVVREKWRGKGVGSLLMDWGLSRADKAGWPTVLEALPNARPVRTLQAGRKFR